MGGQLIPLLVQDFFFIKDSSRDSIHRSLLEHSNTNLMSPIFFATMTYKKLVANHVTCGKEDNHLLGIAFIDEVNMK